MRVLFYDKRTQAVVTYEPEIHRTQVRMFLYWEGMHDLLICSGDSAHVALYQNFKTFGEENLPQKSQPDFQPVSGGRARNGEVVEWGSVGFGLYWPRYKSEICEALQLSDGA